MLTASGKIPLWSRTFARSWGPFLKQEHLAWSLDMIFKQEQAMVAQDDHLCILKDMLRLGDLGLC